MKTKLILSAFVSILSGQICMAQTNEPAEDWKPAPSNQAGKEYPQVNSEGRVTFRVNATKAQSATALFTRRPTTTRIQKSVIRFFTCNMALVKMKPAGVTRAIPAGSWTT